MSEIIYKLKNVCSSAHRRPSICSTKSVIFRIQWTFPDGISKIFNYSISDIKSGSFGLRCQSKHGKCKGQKRICEARLSIKFSFQSEKIPDTNRFKLVDVTKEMMQEPNWYGDIFHNHRKTCGPMGPFNVCKTLRHHESCAKTEQNLTYNSVTFVKNSVTF